MLEVLDKQIPGWRGDDGDGYVLVDSAPPESIMGEWYKTAMSQFAITNGSGSSAALQTRLELWFTGVTQYDPTVLYTRRIPIGDLLNVDRLAPSPVHVEWPKEKGEES